MVARVRRVEAAEPDRATTHSHGHDVPADLTDRLRAAGFAAEERETVLIGLAADMAAAPVLPDGVVQRQVTEDADMRRIADMQSTVWEQDWSGLGDDLISRVAAAPEEIAVMVAEADGTIISAAWLVFRPGADFAGLWGGSTLRQWRGRGLYRALVACRAHLAATRGVRYLQVDASDDSDPILRRLGFHAISTTTAYVWTPGEIR